MRPLRILFIGGTGIISTACVPRGARTGRRGAPAQPRHPSTRPVPEGAVVHTGDVRDPESVRAAIDDLIRRRRGVPRRSPPSTSQPTSTSSPAAPISTSSSAPPRPTRPRRPTFRSPSRRRCATRTGSTRGTRSPARTSWSAAYRRDGLPGDRSCVPRTPTTRRCVPFDGGWTVVDRMRRGKGVVVPGDGTSLWTITHHTDFARGFVGLLRPRGGARRGVPHHRRRVARPGTTSTARSPAAAGVAEPDLVHVPSDAVAAVDPEWGAALLGDKANSMVFDNSKIRRLVPGFRPRVPFARGAREILDWHDAHPEAQVVDPHVRRAHGPARRPSAYRPPSVSTESAS